MHIHSSVYHGSLSHTHKYILNYQRVQWRTNRRLIKWFICIRSVFKVSWLLVMCPEQSHRLSKGFVNRLWLWCVYHVVCEEMMSLVYVCVCSHKHCLSLELQAHTVHSCCLSTDFCTICTFCPCLSLCVVLSEKIAFLLYKATSVFSIYGEYLTMISCDAPFPIFSQPSPFFTNSGAHFCLLWW